MGNTRKYLQQCPKCELQVSKVSDKTPERKLLKLRIKAIKQEKKVISIAKKRNISSLPYEEALKKMEEPKEK